LLRELGSRADGPCDLEALATIDIDRLLAAAVTIDGRGAPGAAFRPMVDGVSVATHPIDAASSEDRCAIPLLVGWCAQETTLLLGYDVEQRALHEGGRWSRLVSALGTERASVVEHYRQALPDATPTELFVAMTTDRVRIPIVQLAEARAGAGAPTCLYRVDSHHPVAGGAYQAVHGVEWPLVFDNCHLSRAMAEVPPARDLAAEMARTWAAFARSGPAALGPDAEFRPARPAALVFDTECRREPIDTAKWRQAWTVDDLRFAGLVSRTPGVRQGRRS
jgi:para-nitrobenzyl esterase